MARIEKVISSLWFLGLVISIVPLVFVGAIVETALTMNRQKK